MKKIVYLLIVAGGLLAAASCTKRYNTVIPNQTVYKDIAPTDWTTTDTGKNYTTLIQPPINGNFGLSSDGVLIYFTFDNGNTYEQIPEVYNNVSFSYTVTGSLITLYAQSSTGTGTTPLPVALTAKIILVPSN